MKSSVEKWRDAEQTLTKARDRLQTLTGPDPYGLYGANHADQAADAQARERAEQESWPRRQLTLLDGWRVEYSRKSLVPFRGARSGLKMGSWLSADVVVPWSVRGRA
jgi:hypothetical protein